jgi:hypothetical protein
VLEGVDTTIAVKGNLKTLAKDEKKAERRVKHV